MRQAETTWEAGRLGTGVGAFLWSRRTEGNGTAPKDMKVNGKMGLTAAFLVTSVLLAVPGVMRAQLVPPAGPNDTASARFTLGDIWSRLATGAAGAKRGAAFAEPVAGPATPTMKTTDDIMAAAPAADNVNGATPADVASGKTFWSLRTSGGVWGLQTGSGMIAINPAPVEKSGQTQCYKYDSGTLSWVLDVGCAVNTPPNQDGKLRKGVVWPNPRFTKNVKAGGSPDGTVTDNLTGLIWLGNANCFGQMTWVNAMNAANALASGACGLDDSSTIGQWRLPNVRELASLIDYGYFDPALSNTAGTGQWTEGNPFANVPNNYFWTSSTHIRTPAQAFMVWLDSGGVNMNPRSVAASVWPVRGGQ